MDHKLRIYSRPNLYSKLRFLSWLLDAGLKVQPDFQKKLQMSTSQKKGNISTSS